MKSTPILLFEKLTVVHMSSTEDSSLEHPHHRARRQLSVSQHSQPIPKSSTERQSSWSPNDGDPKFTLFPSLPTELRQKIWFLNHPAEREIINIALVTIPTTRIINGSKYSYPVRKYDWFHKLPTNFYACPDSRRYTIETLGYYFCFEENFTRGIWFRPEVDRLHFESVAVVIELKYFKWSEESLAIFARSKHISIGGLEDYGLTLFKNLRSLIIQNPNYPGSSLETNLILNFKWDWVKLRLTDTHPTRRPFNDQDSIFGDRMQELTLYDDGNRLGTRKGGWESEKVSDKVKREMVESMKGEIPEVTFMGKREMLSWG
ncbi:hypothetical protein BGZ60DRAFT_567879 [Tricladium varicosporioides]|nr:hypothetical protein BGZ60DRAFT_567879 [Hymenoscyphus varicosporioides]